MARIDATSPLASTPTAKFACSPGNVVRSSGAIPVKGTQRQVPRLAGDLENETIRKSDCRPTAEQPKARRYHVGVLKGQLLMIEEHVDRSDDLPGLVTNDEPHEDLRINRAHAVCGDTFEFPPSRRLVASLFEQHAGKLPGALPWS
ncbi:MAG: hypothetical protein U1F31_08850 [Steroidobacteraceae bacterium]